MKHPSLQLKIGLSYIGVIAAVLLLLNTYPLVVSQNMIFRSKQTTLQNSVSIMTTALAGLDRLDETNVSAAMASVGETGVSRVLVTDEAGLILYDTREADNARGRYGLYTEIVQALRGYDVFHSRFIDSAFESCAASPVLYRGRTVGAVYAFEYDALQASLLLSLQRNLMSISIVVATAVVLLSVFLSRMLTKRFAVLLEAIRKVRQGAYSYRAEIGGYDEIGEIAAEFNRLSMRLQKTEEARRRFVADASHELKTPLAGIRLLSDSILQTEGMDAETVREFVADIEQEASRLTRITENLLRLTRLDAQAYAPPVPVAVSPVLERVVHMLRPIAQEKSVSVNYELAEDCTVLFTEDDLHQVLYNLAENAVKYNREGGFVDITVKREDKMCVLQVEDNGIGIPEEDMSRIFDRFYRVDKMRSRAAGGSGLGLSITADTVRRRGGSIKAAHRAGGGTRFTARIPLAGEVEK